MSLEVAHAGNEQDNLYTLITSQLSWKIIYISDMISFHCQISEPPPYYGTLIGKLSNKEEGISGKIYAVDKSTVFIRNFTYVGENSRTYAYS